MKAILADQSRNWTLDRLAEEAGTSRATLVRLFRRATDKPPLALEPEIEEIVSGPPPLLPERRFVGERRTNIAPFGGVDRRAHPFGRRASDRPQ